MLESEEQPIEVELSGEMVRELTSRASTMGLTADEYATCILGQWLLLKEEQPNS